MTIQTAILTPNGLTSTKYRVESLAEAAQHEPPGVYTVTRTYQTGNALLLDAHLDRLEESARLENMNITLDREHLRRGLRDLIRQSGYEESRFRITLPYEEEACIYLALEPLHPVPPEIRQNGVHVITIRTHRENPNAKTTAWMSQRQKAVEGRMEGMYEAFLVDDDGCILEGTTSNFYAVLDGVLHTAGEGILKGISRIVLLEVAQGVIPVSFTPIRIENIPRLAEAFLTSSSRGVIPIVSMDGMKIGEGKPGAVTLDLQRRYDAWTEANIKPI